MEDLSNSEDINGQFPDQIYIKTRTQSFNSLYDFILVDGRIYYKERVNHEEDAENEEIKHKTQEWKLLTETGVPHSRAKKFFHPSRIVEISADADELMALSNEGRFYHLFFKRGIRQRANVWYDTQGWPSSTPLIMNDLVSENLGWATGIRNEYVFWYEDIYGYQHHYGTMGINTIYVLCRDGQEIRFADTGLPSDFSHNFLGPERGRFVSQAISASASTMFLINETGEMYTRLVDFDTVGSDPMFFKYSYKNHDVSYPGSDYRSNFTPWSLPAENWLKQPIIPLNGQAAISRRITILQNGYGNAARELRVAGLDKNGNTGYYSKAIFGDTWNFVPVKLFLSDSDFLSAGTDFKKAPRGKALQVSLEGNFYKGGIQDKRIHLSTSDFSIHEGDCELEIIFNDEKVNIILHPVESWSYLKRYNPGRDGSQKSFLITFEVPQNSTDGVSSDFKIFLEENFIPYDRKIFSFSGQATEDYLLIDQLKSVEDPISIFLKREEAIDVPPDVFRFYTLYKQNGDLINKGISDDLIYSNARNAQVTERSVLAEKIRANVLYKEELEGELEMLKEAKRSVELSRFSYSLVDKFSALTLLNRVNFPKIKTLTSHGDSLMKNVQENIEFLNFSKKMIYRFMISLVDERINQYEKIINDFNDNKLSSTVSHFYGENYYELLAKVGMADDILGKVFIDGKEVCPCRLESAGNVFPGFVLFLEDEVETVFLIEVKDIIDEVTDRKTSNLKDEPFSAKVEFYLLNGGEIENSANSDYRFEHNFKGNIFWDGRYLIIERKTSLWSSETFILRGA